MLCCFEMFPCLLAKKIIATPLLLSSGSATAALPRNTGIGISVAPSEPEQLLGVVERAAPQAAAARGAGGAREQELGLRHPRTHWALQVKNVRG